MQIMFIIWSTWCSEILEQSICDPKNIITPITFLAHKHVIVSSIIRKDLESVTSKYIHAGTFYG